MNTSRTRSCSRVRRRERFRPASIRARRIAGSKGFGRKSSAPAPRHRTIASVSSTPEIMITGMWRRVASAFSRSSTSIPSIPGISMSSSTTSGGSVSRPWNAAKPFSAAEVRWPACSRFLINRLRFNSSSSTTRMWPGRACIWSPGHLHGAATGTKIAGYAASPECLTTIRDRATPVRGRADAALHERPRIDGRALPLTSRDGRKDRDGVAVGDRRLQRPQIAHVLVVHVHVDEPV